MTVHELSHFAAAKFMGLESSHITVYPFGLNLKLKNTVIYSLSEEIILYSAGPLSNALMALFGVFLGFGADFYYKNAALFLLNILPIAPLDGGMILKKTLNFKLGYDSGNKWSKIISCIFLVMIISLFAFLIYENSFNPSFCIFLVFLVGNIFFSKEKYDTNLLKELLYAREKCGKKISAASLVGADINTPDIEIAKKFRPGKKCFVVLTDGFFVKEVKTKEQIIGELLDDKIMQYNTTAKNELLRK